MLTEMPPAVRNLSRADKARLIGMLAADLAGPEESRQSGRPVSFEDFGVPMPEPLPRSPGEPEQSLRALAAMGSTEIWSPLAPPGTGAAVEEAIKDAKVRR
jgi:hypothetical protein